MINVAKCSCIVFIRNLSNPFLKRETFSTVYSEAIRYIQRRLLSRSSNQMHFAYTRNRRRETTARARKIGRWLGQAFALRGYHGRSSKTASSEHEEDLNLIPHPYLYRVSCIQQPYEHLIYLVNIQLFLCIDCYE